MFKLVAAFFALSAASPEPLIELSNKQTFATEAACVEFKDGDQGMAARQELDVITVLILRNEGVLTEYKLECREDTDGSI